MIKDFKIKGWDDVNQVFRIETKIIAENQVGNCKKQLLLVTKQQHGVISVILKIEVFHDGFFKWYNEFKLSDFQKAACLYNHMDPNLTSTWKGLILDKKFWTELLGKYPNLRIVGD